jgi:DNA-binding transcriptional regulator YiaG
MLTGEELRRMREAAGLMRRELADLLGLPVAVVKLAEAGRVGLVGAAEVLERIIRAA